MSQKMNKNNDMKFRMIEMADAAEVSVETVRYYTRQGLLIPTRDKQNNYRLFSRSELVKLKFIKRAKTLGYTIAEIKKIIHASINKNSPCLIVREIIENRVNKNKNHINEVIALQKRMESAMQHWKHLPDAIPTGDSICYLIEQETK